ncbi:helix-turn-helix domain-containing protein [Parabacteroides gordonii]|uniref:helix-turn-helix domain-containing protein n=1 Tax=Parabacteroides gordonii TaxID=574930 RepID=UPI0026EABB68|nr:helix-turn-helix domain-containing protein [Parabacteroides gordonii]
MDNETNSLLVMQRLFERVLIVMDKEKPYLDPTLTLGKLVRHVGTNRTLLSTTLNSLSKMNFNHWIATYRVSHLLEAIRNDPDKSFDELYPQSGFASRTSFFRQFRQVTGQTPGEYIKKKSEE